MRSVICLSTVSHNIPVSVTKICSLFLNSFEKDEQHAMMVHTYTRREGNGPPILFQSPREISPQYPLDEILHGAQTHSGLGEIFQMQLLSIEPQ